MEANFFRYLVPELDQSVQGRRVDNVYMPADGLWTLKFTSRSHILAVVDTKRGIVFWNPTRPSNPGTPSGGAQWLRKRLRGRRFVSYRLDWPRRRVAWWVDPGEFWLLWDICTGPRCLEALPEDFGQPPQWPETIDEAVDPQSWRRFPQLSPPLRSTLNALSPESAASLLHALQFSAPTRFYGYVFANGRSLALPWRLPENLRAGASEVETTSALEAARIEGETVMQGRFDTRREADQSQKRALKKLQRQLGHLQEDEHRLKEMSELGDPARFLQANLYRLDPKAKMDSVEGVDVDGSWRHVTLDPAFTVQENMQRLFAKSRKGRRGLPYVRQRKQMLEQEYHDRLQRAGQAAATAPAAPEYTSSEARGCSGPRLPARFQGLAVHMYRSSDGFLLLRGKNKKANHALTKAARPFDLWFHAQGGPGAHVVLVRDHYGQEVPHTSQEQAACLAGLASHASSADKAEVMVALVRDVHPIKGAPLGQVRVEAVQQTLMVALDAAVEKQLRLNTESTASTGSGYQG